MAYQNVGTPRFYINLLEWLETTGYFYSKGAAIETHFRTLPVEPQLYWGSFAYDIPNILGTKNFIAVLGHQLKTDNNNYHMATWTTYGFIVNSTPASGYDGFSISTFPDQLTWISPQFDTWGSYIGSVVVGSYYTMPHSPDLSLTMSREYGGIKTIETKNGSSLSNTMWTKPPMWGHLGAWELSAGGYVPTIQNMAKSGRRTWDLNFSYLDDGDVFGSNQSLATEEWGNLNADPLPYDNYDLSFPEYNFNFNLLTDENFFSQVWHKTLGGTLPFIFQPDSSNNNPDQFAICRFKDSSLKATQSAPNVYDISLSIEEAW